MRYKLKEFVRKYFLITVFFLLGVLFIIQFAGPAILKLYIELGMGTCKDIPIFCATPTHKVSNPFMDNKYVSGLLPYRLGGVGISLPAGFTAVEEEIKKVHYEKKPRRSRRIAYLLYQEPNFFIELFPQLKSQGITNNYEFVRQAMQANLDKIKNLNDAFSIIIKGIFTPDLGEQKNLNMIEFAIRDKRGFINYNTDGKGSYFDCNILEPDDGFFKVYIRDNSNSLDLDKVLAIITTVEKNERENN